MSGPRDKTVLLGSAIKAALTYQLSTPRPEDKEVIATRSPANAKPYVLGQKPPKRTIDPLKGSPRLGTVVAVDDRNSRPVGRQTSNHIACSQDIGGSPRVRWVGRRNTLPSYPRDRERARTPFGVVVPVPIPPTLGHAAFPRAIDGDDHEIGRTAMVFEHQGS